MPNPSGVNSPVAFDRFTRTIPYGEKKVQGDLQRTAPMAGQSAAATPINAPRQAQRAATRPQRQQAQAAQAQPLRPMPEPQAPPSIAETWDMLARSVPGISPLAFDYAQRASQ